MYRETRVGSGGVVCTWERRSARTGTALVVPDGCVDLVRYADGRLEVAGPDTRPWQAPVSAGELIHGLRLAPGAARAVLGVPLIALRDQRVRSEHLPTSSPLRTGRGDLQHVLATASEHAPDELVGEAVRRLRRRPRTLVGPLADQLGVGARHLHRRFVDEIGYGPKMFARVARLQRFLAMATGASATLADVALASGYAGQSHLSDEVRELTGSTPVRFLEDRRRTTQ